MAVKVSIENFHVFGVKSAGFKAFLEAVIICFEEEAFEALKDKTYITFHIKDSKYRYRSSTEEPFYKFCCTGKAIRMSVACKAHAPYSIVICDLSRCTTFFHIIS